MYQLDRSKCERVLVSDDKVEWVERILISSNENGSCVCVSECYEKKFLRGQSFDTVSWVRYKPIHKQEWVMFDSNEELEPYIDCWFRAKGSNVCQRVRCYDLVSGNVLGLDCWHSREELYRGCEMKVNGKWQPVGKLKGGEG